ncbi:hypothetical protein VKT23_010277 [Stygiomarasmius scandens]|uniref:AAA+ ATPase domain-containing protein n=1 Tax=Marasmiellus scandens TaxID=2682957 RepID=A0ABR1JB59_9AGAR
MLKSLKIIMEHNRTINWKADPVKFDLQGLLAYMPFLRAYLRKLQDGTLHNRQEMAAHLEFLIEFLDKEYRDMLLEAESLKASAQVTFRCLWALFIPGSILLTRCPITQDICAVKLVDMQEVEPFEDREVMSRHCALRCEYISIQSCRPGFSEEIVKIPEFNGARRIQDLGAYPLETVKDFINQAEDLSRRGRRHWDLACKNWCHMQYQAIAFRQERKKRIRKTFVESRVIIDQEMYDVYHPKVATPGHETDLDGNEMNSHSRLELHNEEFMLLSPRCTDCLCQIENGLPVQVKKTILALAKTQKEHEIHFDDFVVGKGRGLIFNLDGPPGIGKTLTAEATSEVMRSPLYTIGAGDLGTTAGDLDRVLSMISILSDRWKAVVLIDEADVFLERRTSKDIHRNAMVAVFLRQLEYYPGILFLTTNRVEVFDEAMVTRIQVSLSYRTLTADAREHLWSAFTSSGSALTLEQREFLREIALNGREIKNIVKVATALAAHDKHVLEFKHLLQAFRF